MSRKKFTLAMSVFIVGVMLFIGIIMVRGAIFGSSSSSDYQIPDYDVQYKSMNVSVDFNSDRSCKVVNRISAEFLKSKHGIIVYIPLNSGEKVRNLTVDCELPYSIGYESGRDLISVVIGDANNTRPRGYVLNCTLRYEYITPEHPSGSDILAFMPIGNGWASPIDDAKVTMTYPVAPDFTASDLDYGIYVAGNLVEDGSSAVLWSEDKRTVTVNAGRLAAFSGVEIAYKMPNGTLVNNVDYGWISIVVAGGILLAVTVVLMCIFGRDKPLTPILEFYPPRVTGADGEQRRLLPVQMGKIIDGKCSDEDVTSLIFYWASEGYLAIEDCDDGTYLCKLKNIKAVTGYERTLFDRLFANANKGRIKVADDGKFAGAISSTKTAVNNEYRGKFYKTKGTALVAVITALCALFGILSAVLVTFRISIGFFNLIGLLLILPVLVTAGLGATLNRYYFKLTAGKRKLFFVLYILVTMLLAVAVTVVIPTDVMSWFGKVLFAIELGGTAAIAPFLGVRTEYYDELLNPILGFAMFLRDAEKERLEQLLADDPQYYYNILPYANVLGVSDIWADKFKDLTVPPPTYYRCRRHDVLFDIFMFRRLSRRISRSVSTMPKPTGGSFSSAGGGRRGGGGGFSGGSFGGGGGRSW